MEIPVKKRSRSFLLSPELSRVGGYQEAPIFLQEWIAASSETSTSSNSEAGRRMGNYNVRKVVTADVLPSDIGLVAVEELDGDEARNMDFIASSNVLFFEFLGAPGALSYLRCLGCLSEHDEASALSGKRFTVASPSHFLVTSGDFAAMALELKSTSVCNGRSAEEESREKRTALRAQDAGGERTEGEKRGTYMITTRDGVRLPTRDKSNLQSRCDQLEFMWRAAERDLWKHMAGSGYKLQSDIYWNIVLEEAEVLQQPIGSAFQRAGKIYLISGTTIARDLKVLELFLRGGFGDENLTLDSFCAGSKLSMLPQPCSLQNAPLVSALEALAVALEVLFSYKFAGVCDDLVEMLRGHVRPLRLTDSGFLVHTVERVFVKFFRIVSKDDEAQEFPGSDITSPTGCASLLKEMLAGMVKELMDVAKATILEKRYTVFARLRKERVIAPVIVAKAKPIDKPQERNGEGSVEQCGSHLGQLLKARKKNGAPLLCAKGKQCKYLHGKISDLTRPAAIALVATMPQWLQDCLSPLVTTCKGFKP